MRINNFPWSPALAGFGSGMAGFVIAALVSGILHLGAADTCRSPASVARSSLAGGVHATTAATQCPCCCNGHAVITTDSWEESDPQLAAIELCSTVPVGVATGFEPGVTTAGAASLTGVEPATAPVSLPTRLFLATDAAANTDTAPLRLASIASDGRGGWSGVMSPSLAPLGGGWSGLSSFSGPSSGGAVGSSGSSGSVAGDRAIAGSLAATLSSGNETGVRVTNLATLLGERDQASLAAVAKMWADAATGLLVVSTPSLAPANLGAEPAPVILASFVGLQPGRDSTLLGSQTHDAGVRAVTGPVSPVAVPEPSSVSLSLLACGVAGVAASRRHWRHRREGA